MQSVNTTPTIEVCINAKFICEHIINSDHLDYESPNDALVCLHWVHKFIDQLNAYGIDWKLARGQRILYQGWNEARFKTRGVGWGSFNGVSHEQKIDIDVLALRAADEVTND
jgi:hypothetical protein